MRHTLKGDGVSLVLQDAWNVLQLLEEELPPSTVRSLQCPILHYQQVCTYSIESTHSHNHFIQQCSNAPDVHFVIIVLWEGGGCMKRERDHTGWGGGGGA